MKVLILGITGMLGNAVFREYSRDGSLCVYGTVRSELEKSYFEENVRKGIIPSVNVENHDSLMAAFIHVKPDIVVNCIGLVKQALSAGDPLQAIPINALLPHRLASLCKLSGARLIHISTDCVYSGKKGNYEENDFPDANDLYGRTKYLGEVNYPHSITLRTSIIGHELKGNRSLVDWFLSQSNSVKGFQKAIFSGMPAIELARIIRDYVIPAPELSGLFHVSVDSINKFDLLSLIATQYKKAIEIIPDDSIRINRSLDSSKFRLATGFSPKPWAELVGDMNAFR